MLLFLVLIGWLVIPRIMEQVSQLVVHLPDYYTNLKHQLSRVLDDYPSIQEKLMGSDGIEDDLPSLKNIAQHVGRFSMSVVSGIFFLVMFFSILLYMLIKPRPLVESYLYLFSKEKRQSATRALARASNMVVGYMYSNILVGSMKAAATFAFLSYMKVPGVWVWAGLALFAEMVPKLGLYIMAIPPTLVALSIKPLTALWVFVFFLVLNELMSDFVTPRVRASNMNLHPVSP